jgi:hypothetical protein
MTPAAEAAMRSTMRRAVLGILKRTLLLDRANGVAIEKLAGAAQFGT